MSIDSEGGVSDGSFANMQSSLTQRMIKPNPGEFMMYAEMSGPELVAACRDDAAKWAAAFCEIISDGRTIDEGLMIGWFANAIEGSYDVRTGRGAAVLPDGSGFWVATTRGVEPNG